MKKAEKHINDRDIELLFEMGALRLIPRVWAHFLNSGSANVAEHTLRVMWIALTLARYEGVTGSDEKILKMALLHDIAESRTGDVNYVSRHYTTRDEERANRDILEGSTFGEEALGLLREYEERQTIESKIVKDADNLDVDMELQEMEARGLTLANEFKRERRERIPNALHTKSARAFWEKIRGSNPHEWHLKARKSGAHKMMKHE